jgi:hypothetical protein
MNITLTYETTMIMGLDDSARYPDIERVCKGRLVECIGTIEALTDLVTEINDRATEGTDGFDESTRDKRICARSVTRIIRISNGMIRPRV